MCEYKSLIDKKKAKLANRSLMILNYEKGEENEDLKGYRPDRGAYAESYANQQQFLGVSNNLRKS